MGQVDAIVCSPSYADSLNDGRHSIDPGKGTHALDRSAAAARRHRKRLAGYTAYGTAEGQVGALRAGPCPGGEAGVGDVETLTWGGCYKDSWKGLIVPEAFAHPAKVARGLAVRLFDHGFARGWWHKGDLVADPFMGICGFGIVAAYKGLRFVGVELEPRFHALCLDNVALHRRRWEAGGDPTPLCLRGDSRRFAALVAGAAAVVTSPPYAGTGVGNNQRSFRPDDGRPNPRFQRDLTSAEKRDVGYGATPGQLGALKAGDADAVLTSPPYADTPTIASGVQRNEAGWGAGKDLSAGKPKGYGDTPGNVGALPQGDADGVLTSPPYAASVHGRNGIDLAKCDRPGAHTQAGAQGYGDTPGNVGGLPAGDADSVVTSPPYERSMDSVEDAEARKARAGGFECRQKALRYGQNPNTFLSKDPSGLTNEERREIAGRNPQVGALGPETYWLAMKIIWKQSFLALRPGGVLCCVIKDFVRAKKRVPLCDQTWRLLLSLGFTPVERIRCLLSEETREPSLFGGVEVRKRSRVSFFRRLAEKRGAPPIDAEEILVVRRP